MALTLNDIKWLVQQELHLDLIERSSNHSHSKYEILSYVPAVRCHFNSFGKLPKRGNVRKKKERLYKKEILNILIFQSIAVEAERSPIDDLLPSHEEEADSESMEAKSAHNSKREVSPIFNLIIDILDTIHSSARSDLKRAKNKERRFT